MVRVKTTVTTVQIITIQDIMVHGITIFNKGAEEITTIGAGVAKEGATQIIINH